MRYLIIFPANKERHFGSGNFHDQLMSLLKEKYGVESVEESDDGVSITITLDGIVAVIDLETLVRTIQIYNLLVDLCCLYSFGKFV